LYFGLKDFLVAEKGRFCKSIIEYNNSGDLRMRKINIISTSQDNGGINQLTFVLARTAIDLGFSVMLFLPNINKLDVPPDLLNITIHYRLPKGLNSRNIDEICGIISENKPDMIFFTSNSIQAYQILSRLKEGLCTSIIVHDVNEHPIRYNVKILLRRAYKLILITFLYPICFKKVTSITLLSTNSYQKFVKKYSKHKKKAIIMPLAVLVVTQDEKMPIEIETSEPFYLFFGRIEKYKGVEKLIRVYNAENNKNIPRLVIAGKGNMQKHEASLANDNDNIILINRFIKNEEMNWLIKNCICVVLPYLEASQSGILPIAYSFGKPVITSNIEGLRELVIKGKTGFVFDTEDELLSVLKQIQDTSFLYSANIATKKFAEENFNINKNLLRVIQKTVDY
jgi:glycosyltransferase involved in cell wall biosynthesis